MAERRGKSFDMKTCPRCHSTYSDPTLRFCLQDGTQLVSAGSAAEDPSPTAIIGPAPTERIPPAAPTIPYGQSPQLVMPGTAGGRAKSNIPVVVILTAVVTTLLLAIVGLGAWVLLRERDNANTQTAKTNNSPVETNNAQTTIPQTKNQNTPPPTPSPLDRATVERQVTTALNRWADSIRNRDLIAHMSSYAGLLDTYYNANKVSAARVRADRAKAFSMYSQMDVQLSNIAVTLDGPATRAVATFDKTYHFSGERTFSGSSRSQLIFAKSDRHWLIVSEKDLKVYYVNK